MRNLRNRWYLCLVYKNVVCDTYEIVIANVAMFIVCCLLILIYIIFFFFDLGQIVDLTFCRLSRFFAVSIAVVGFVVSYGS